MSLIVIPRKIYLHNFLFYIGFAILLINKYARIVELLTTSFFATNYIYLLGMFLLILSVFTRKFIIRDLLLIGYGFFSFIVAHDTTLFSLLVLNVASKNRNLDDVAKFYVRFQSMVLGTCIMLYPLFLMLGSSVATISYISGRTRYNFFFSHPNNFAVQCVFTVLMYLYTKRKIFSYSKVNVILIFTAMFLYVFPNSQTAALSIIIYMLCRFMVRYARWIWKHLIKVILPIISLAVIIIVYMYYSGKADLIISYLSDTFSSRFVGAAMAFHLYPVNLFGYYLRDIGQKLYVEGQWGIFWFDLAYVRVLFAFGIVGAAIFYYILIKGIKKYIREKNYDILSLFVVIMAYAVSEWTAFSITTVFPLVFLNVSLLKKKNVIYK